MDEPLSDSGKPIPSLPYATPKPESDEVKSEHLALAIIIFFLAACAACVFWIGGPSWPSVVVIGFLCIVAIAFGHFATRK
jgi:hypothetical protein